MRRARLVAPAVAQVSRWVVTLSLDEPHLYRHDEAGVAVVDARLFCATWWAQLAVAAAMDPAYPIPTGEHPAGKREDPIEQ